MKQFKIKVQVLYLYFFFCNIYIRQQKTKQDKNNRVTVKTGY